MNSTATIFARLAAVASSLATYEGASAIFDETAPDDFLIQDPRPEKPFIVIAAPSSDVALETFTERGRMIVQDVRAYQRRTGSAAELDALMRAVRDLFHNAPETLAVAGGVCDVARVTGPVQSPTSDEAYLGRRITIRLDFRNT